jgi:hypothetical protein
VIVGFVVMAIAVGGGTAAASKMLLTNSVGGEMPRPTYVYLIVNLVLNDLAALLDGPVLSRIADRSPMIHAGILAVLGPVGIRNGCVARPRELAPCRMLTGRASDELALQIARARTGSIVL